MLRLAAVAAMLWAAGSVATAAQDSTVTASEATLRDFMIQNVCLDAAGAVLVGVAPIDGDRRCVGQRDLRPGERLPYHKHDHSPPEDRIAAPNGYQRHDSFPVDTAAFGAVVEHSFDFGAQQGRRFGVFDASDGGDVAILSPGTVSIGATTDDYGSGYQLWVGECQGRVTPAAVAHSWIVAQYDPNQLAPLRGDTIARLNRVSKDRQELCPSHFNAGFTQWAVRPFGFRTARAQGMPVTLTTLISDHYGTAAAADANHVERFYFTRELGGTRWERWENGNGTREVSAARVAALAAQLAATGRCSPTETPPGGAPLMLVDCREWTQIEPPADPAGDRPGFFLDTIRARPDAPALFAPPAKPG